MTFRKTGKSKTLKRLALERITLSTRQIFTIDLERCVGCGICEKVCPEKALSRPTPPTVKDGRLVRKIGVDIDDNKCTFCGECVPLCPMNAISIEIDGQEKVPVIEKEVFPNIFKRIDIEVSKCNPVCKLVCQEKCPVKALQVIVKREEPEGEKIIAVNIDRKLCIYCKQCEVACPLGAVHVIKPMKGSVELNINLCPQGCQACVDICPSKAIIINHEGKPKIDQEFCIYCGACEEVCPEKAVKVVRTSILHSEVKSGAWNEALEKITSYISLVKELNVKCKRKAYVRASAVEERAEAIL
jgi:4Fe-4S ferredoxin